MPEVIDLNDALRVYLPKTLSLPPDVTISNFQWMLHDDINDDRTYPYGTIELLNTTPRFAGRKQTRQATQVLLTQVDTIAFAAGTLTYELVQWDAESIQSVTGTRLGVAHTFAAGTDFTLSGLKTITWTPGGNKPDDATNFVVTYKHRKYRRHFGMDGSVSVRLHIVAKAYQGPTRKYTKAQMAWLLALAVEQYLRLNAGKVLYKPPNNAPVPLHLEATASDVLSTSKEYIDPSEGIESWAVDFRVNASYIVRNPEVEAVLTLGIEPEVML